MPTTAPSDPANKLYYGDNLDILRGYPPASVDLIYLDPPFNSNRDYNVIFRDESGNRSDAQQFAFEDTWHWGPRAEKHFAFLTNTQIHRGRVPTGVSTLIDAVRRVWGENQMTAYLVEMTVRLVELHRVLKPTGSLYLHCDPTASHYLKLVLDAIFGATRFQNEIIWWYHDPSGKSVTRFMRKHDVIFFYAGEKHTFNVDAVRTPYAESTAQAGRRGTISFGRPTKTHALGRLPEDVWEIPIVNSMAKERVGYPTQKPLALLEKIVLASSNPGDTVLDPFCGCGTALDAAQKHGRRWVGIDITYLAIGVVRRRLMARYPDLTDVPVVNRPTELAGARRMALDEDGRYQFQWWALDEIGATPRTDERKKGADGGIDGSITFTDATGMQSVIVSVKSGHPRLDDVRVLRAVVEHEKAAIGVLVTLDEPTAQMRQDAAAAGFWHSDLFNRDYTRIQILSAKDLIEGRRQPDLPPSVAAPYMIPPRTKKVADQSELWAGRSG
jgi:site-specific DNA-methyltransferase (adenine-specific)